jgi:hypothetical protein
LLIREHSNESYKCSEINISDKNKTMIKYISSTALLSASREAERSLVSYLLTFWGEIKVTALRLSRHTNKAKLNLDILTHKHTHARARTHTHTHTYIHTHKHTHINTHTHTYTHTHTHT